MSVKDIDLGWKKILKNFKDLNNAYTAVGFPGEDNTNVEGESFTVAELAAVHEYGRKDGSIPSRPFMRQTYDNNQPGIEKQRAILFEEVIMKKGNPKKWLGRLGEWYAGRVIKTIDAGRFTPLANSTVKAKGSSKPLVDTGVNLRGRITHKEFI